MEIFDIFKRKRKDEEIVRQQPVADSNGRLLPSTVLKDRYRILRVLGQGGCGITYAATDARNGVTVAVKEFYPKEFCDRDYVTGSVLSGHNNRRERINEIKRKFIKEAKMLETFQHPNIVRSFDVFEENDTAYYVMDYIEGISLSEKIRRDGTLDLETSLWYLKEIGAGLEYIHSRMINL